MATKKTISVQATAEDVTLLEKLMKKLGQSQSGILRLAIRKLAIKEKIAA